MIQSAAKSKGSFGLKAFVRDTRGEAHHEHTNVVRSCAITQS